MFDTSIFHGRKAISYQRWSTTKQDGGDSQDRQDSTAQEFCRRHKLELIDTIRDQGVSAFKGSNVKAQLGRLIESYQTGEISKGVVLIIDDYSRLTRMDASDAQLLFLNLIVSGITLGIAKHDTFINKQIYDANTAIPLTTLVGLSAANQESQQKSWAVKQTYVARAKRLAAGEKIKLASLPFWIHRETYQVLEEHRPTLERLIDLIRSGNSYLNTSRILNDEGVSPPKGKMWRQSSVQSIMNNPALYGASKFGEGVHEGIFEPLMEKTQWQLVHEQNKGRRRAPRSVSGSIPNLFPSMLRCGKCGGPMSIHATQRDGRSYQYFRCFDSKALPREERCGNKTIKVEAFELSMLNSLVVELEKERDITPVVDDRERDIKRLTKDVEEIERKLDVAMDRAVSAGSEVLRDRYEKTVEELDGRLRGLNKQLTELKLSKPVSQELDVDDLEQMFSTMYEDRKNNRQVLQARLSRIIDNVSLTLGSCHDVVDDPGVTAKTFKGLADVTLKDGSKFTVGLYKS